MLADSRGCGSRIYALIRLPLGSVLTMIRFQPHIPTPDRTRPKISGIKPLPAPYAQWLRNGLHSTKYQATGETPTPDDTFAMELPSPEKSFALTVPAGLSSITGIGPGP